jgi:hypothetical protein
MTKRLGDGELSDSFPLMYNLSKGTLDANLRIHLRGLPDAL